jgi:hypothetical protein
MMFIIKGDKGQRRWKSFSKKRGIWVMYRRCVCFMKKERTEKEQDKEKIKSICA